MPKKSPAKSSAPDNDVSARLRAMMRQLKTAGSYRVLEPRMVFDGAAVATTEQAVSDSPADAAAVAANDAAAPTAMDVAAALASVVEALKRSGDATAEFVRARRVLGGVTRAVSTDWSRVSPP